MRVFRLGCCCWLLLHSLVQAVSATTPAPTTIHWLTLEMPPYYLQGEILGRDQAVAELIANLVPEYVFRPTQVPHRRIAEILAEPKGDNFCVVSLFRTLYREQHVLLSEYPVTIGLPLQLITKPEWLPKLAFAKEAQGYRLARISALFAHDIALPLNRSYGAQLDPWLQSANIQRVVAETGLGHVLPLMMQGRAQMSLGYPDEIGYYQQQSPGKWLAVPLLESTAPSLGYLGCNNTPDNQQMVRRLNQRMDDLYQDPMYLVQLQRWLDEEGRQQVAAELARQLQFWQIKQRQAPGLPR